MIEPVYQREGVTLYHGDCREIVPSLVMFDLLLTDPPYLIRAGKGGGCFGSRDHLAKTGGFTDGGVDFGFLHSVPNWFCFCSRLQLPALLAVAQTSPRWNLLTWCKPNPVPTCNNKYLPDVEFIVHGFRSGRLFGGMSSKSCFMVHPCGSKETTHPNEKPLALIRKLVMLGSQPSETILDPFMGSGTTGVVCVQTGRRFIGIELDRKYVDIAIKRIDAAIDDVAARFDFAKPQAQEQQLSLLDEGVQP